MSLLYILKYFCDAATTLQVSGTVISICNLVTTYVQHLETTLLEPYSAGWENRTDHM